tara:strand:- start:254 stop:1033 length:780 start_codon:yes stop_codon:yes gene_type:complete
MSDTPINLDELRQRIDQLDSDILNLISERANCAQQVAHVKLAEDKDAVFYRPEREAQVLRRIMALNKGPLDSEEMARLFREIMSACLALEQPVKVAYLGPEGTFTQQAALKHFGESAVSLPMAAIDEVFREVEAGAVHYGVVPVEFSTPWTPSWTPRLKFVAKWCCAFTIICWSAKRRAAIKSRASIRTRNPSASAANGLMRTTPMRNVCPFPPMPKQPSWCKPNGTVRPLLVIWRLSFMAFRILRKKLKTVPITPRGF